MFRSSFFAFGILASLGSAHAKDKAVKRTGLLVYTVTMIGEATGAAGEQKWVEKTNRTLKGRIPIMFLGDYSVEGDLKAHEAMRPRSPEPQGIPPSPPPVSPALSDMFQTCAKSGKEGAGMVTCIQETARRVCETQSGEDKENACALARNLRQDQQNPPPPSPPASPPLVPVPLARSGEMWRGDLCELTSIVEDQNTGTRPYDPLTRGPYVSKSFTNANWTSQRVGPCADVRVDKLAKTIRLILPLPRDVKASIRYESPVQTMEEKRTLSPFRDAGLPGDGYSIDLTAVLNGEKSVSGSSLYKPKGEKGVSTLQTKLEWTVSFD